MNYSVQEQAENRAKAEHIELRGDCRIMERRGLGAVMLCGIYGEIEGHERLPSGIKTASYEKLIPDIAFAENSYGIDGVLVLINTPGGDVESGLAISELLASLSKPVVSLVLGGGHSIGMPLAVSGDVSFIVPTATMIVHPIRISQTVLGVKQNFEYIEKMQDRIIDFTVRHSKISEAELKKLMFNTGELTSDVGSVLVGAQAAECGIIDRVGGVDKALNTLYDLIYALNDSKIPMDE